MIQKFASEVTKWLEDENVISYKDYALFAYAAYSFIFGLLPVFIVATLGLAFGMIREGLIMILPFMVIRKFSGGYHLKSSKICVILSTTLLVLGLTCIKAIVQKGDTTILSLLVFLSVVSVCIFSPVENASRKMTEAERQLFHKITCVLAMGFMALYFIISRVLPIQNSIALGIGVLLVAVLQIPYVLKKIILKFCQKIIELISLLNKMFIDRY